MYGSKHAAILFSSLIALRGARGVDLATVSITAAEAYAVEQVCVQDCLFGSIDGLQEWLGCTRFAELALP
jgi:hypothetical protein